MSGSGKVGTGSHRSDGSSRTGGDASAGAEGRSRGSSSRRSREQRTTEPSASQRSGHTSHGNGDADFDLQEIVDHIFRLDEEEEVLKDYYCAIQGKILLHGRMYLSNLRLMFYSNVFGIVSFCNQLDVGYHGRNEHTD